MHYTDDPRRQYHIDVVPEEIGKYVILTGDPKRVPKIAQMLDGAVPVADKREYVTYTGSLDGVAVSVVSTGIGGPSAAIALTELAKCGAHTFIRVGTCGGMQDAVIGGDLIIGTASVRQEGTSREYAPLQIPAAADIDVVNALVASAEENGYPRHRMPLEAPGEGEGGFTALQIAAQREMTDEEAAGRGHRAHVGILQSKDSFYGEHEPGIMPVSETLLSDWKAYLATGVLGSEMETAALFTAGLFLRVRVGAVVLVMANQEREAKGYENPVVHETDAAIRTAVGAMRRIIAEDRTRK